MNSLQQVLKNAREKMKTKLEKQFKEEHADLLTRLNTLNANQLHINDNKFAQLYRLGREFAKDGQMDVTFTLKVLERKIEKKLL